MLRVLGRRLAAAAVAICVVVFVAGVARGEDTTLMFLTAISLGAVFMGAMTYIGNGPNFMVKAIAESNNIKMPSFFGYMLYSMAVLLPLSLLMNLVFLL